MDNGTKPETGSGQSWIYSSLIQTARPIASLAAKLGVLPYSYNAVYDRDFINPRYNEEENHKLRDVWKKTKNENEDEGEGEDTQIGFISLHIISQKDKETGIDQIGMSKWRSNGWTGMVSVHCQVEQETTMGVSAVSEGAVSEAAYPRLIAGDFLFGDTEVIIESDVGPWLDATFKSFQINQDIIYLVGHDIHRILHLVQQYWKVPSDVVILDTRAIWEFQNGVTEHPSLEETMEWVTDYRRRKSSIHNAGNISQFLLSLLRAQGRVSEQNRTRV